jgi:hypothetical protein
MANNSVEETLNVFDLRHMAKKRLPKWPGLSRVRRQLAQSGSDVTTRDRSASHAMIHTPQQTFK